MNQHFVLKTLNFRYMDVFSEHSVLSILLKFLTHNDLHMFSQVNKHFHLLCSDSIKNFNNWEKYDALFCQTYKDKIHFDSKLFHMNDFIPALGVFVTCNDMDSIFVTTVFKHQLVIEPNFPFGYHLKYDLNQPLIIPRSFSDDNKVHFIKTFSFWNKACQHQKKFDVDVSDPTNIQYNYEPERVLDRGIPKFIIGDACKIGATSLPNLSNMNKLMYPLENYLGTSPRFVTSDTLSDHYYFRSNFTQLSKMKKMKVLERFPNFFDKDIGNRICHFCIVLDRYYVLLEDGEFKITDLHTKVSKFITLKDLVSDENIVFYCLLHLTRGKNIALFSKSIQILFNVETEQIFKLKNNIIFESLVCVSDGHFLALDKNRQVLEFSLKDK